jgi:hypothetical protein
MDFRLRNVKTVRAILKTGNKNPMNTVIIAHYLFSGEECDNFRQMMQEWKNKEEQNSDN